MRRDAFGSRYRASVCPTLSPCVRSHVSRELRSVLDPILLPQFPIEIPLRSATCFGNGAEESLHPTIVKLAIRPPHARPRITTAENAARRARGRERHARAVRRRRCARR
jgi:hypothetical protein